MAFDALFAFGLFVAPGLTAGSTMGLLALWAAPGYNQRHAALRRSLWAVLMASSGLALLLSGIVALKVE